MTREIAIRLADWDRDRDIIRHIRQTVFVIEQHVAPDIEWDGKDRDAIHVLAGFTPENIVATGRLQRNGKIGRMAVMPASRNHGLGAAILGELVGVALAAGLDYVYLHAQTHAMEFYRRHGFVAEGPEFDEAGIPHRLMRRNLRRSE